MSSPAPAPQPSRFSLSQLGTFPGILLMLAVGGLSVSSCSGPTPSDPAKPPAPSVPSPPPHDPNKPSPPVPDPLAPPKPWGPEQAAGRPQLGSKVSPDGKVEALDLPESEKKRNVGGSDGAGLCVFTSIEYCARWQNERRLFDFQKQMRQELGGGYPEKVDKMMKKYAPGVPYIQDTSKDYELIKLAVQTGRMVGVTYDGKDPHYSGSIAHMVTLAWADDTWVAITDNNFPKDNEHVWMSVPEFMKRFGDGWCVILLAPPPPPVPRSPK